CGWWGVENIGLSGLRGVPVRPYCWGPPKPQSSTYAVPLLSITCEVIARERPGTGPAAVPSSTSLVPLASFSAACVCCGSQRGPPVCAIPGAVVATSAGAAARPASTLRRERPDVSDVSVTLLPLGCRCLTGV